MLTQSSPAASRSSRNRKLTKLRSAVSGPPSAGSTRRAGILEAVQRFLRHLEDHRVAHAVVDASGVGAGLAIGGPK